MELKNYTNAQLTEELERREKLVIQRMQLNSFTGNFPGHASP